MEPLPGARNALAALTAARVPWLLLTNGGGELESKKAAKISAALGYPVRDDQVVLSHTPMRALCAPLAQQRVLVLGCRDSLAVARHYGLQRAVSAMDMLRDTPALYPFIDVTARVPLPDRDEPFAAVMVLHDPNSWGLELQVCMDVLRGGAPLGSGSTQAVPYLYSNDDLTFSAAHPVPRLAAGSFTLALKALWAATSGVREPLRVTAFGKPSTVTFNYAQQQLLEVAAADAVMLSSFSRVFMVGDNPRSDIRGARAAGAPWSSILVRSGVFRGGGNDALDPADAVVQDVAAAVELVLRHR